ncbi:MAG: bis(5'-nucleosyl)-tetraphosphatase [Planctomycetaceae bacterium]
MKIARSCGFLIVRGEPVSEFLLMKHKKRWDLPKGHVDPGETDIECALRELEEETGISVDDIEIDDDFVFEHKYKVKAGRYGPDSVKKTLLIYLGWLTQDVDITVTEHLGYEWFPYKPPHEIQGKTIDPLLAAVEDHLQGD